MKKVICMLIFMLSLNLLAAERSFALAMMKQDSVRDMMIENLYEKSLKAQKTVNAYEFGLIEGVDQVDNGKEHFKVVSLCFSRLKKEFNKAHEELRSYKRQQDHTSYNNFKRSYTKKLARVNEEVNICSENISSEVEAIQAKENARGAIVWFGWIPSDHAKKSLLKSIGEAQLANDIVELLSLENEESDLFEYIRSNY
ncbi:hypothetical protein OAT67_09765 [Bacteriovoracaceae bacterium]|nr:hypothetical protein [Bacteriovoracaceae bacterium]